ncbi:hypothetical protein F4560_001686 [Saccharothrix ecbatanensis]|uniref:Uncharacterized protein n=1 Tax=Saccharothrix ecbatanensis TaxID=1105145 RepID=A0A7W9HGM8_9PSEU|nr:hypothetical protein [Saccharothrix ecbatanensis]
MPFRLKLAGAGLETFGGEAFTFEVNLAGDQAVVNAQQS